MKKTALLMACMIVLLVLYLVLIKRTDSKTDPQKEYLKKVLANLEQIKSATYVSTVSIFNPWDTEPSYTTKQYFKAYNNPSDTVVGVSFVWFKDEAQTKLGSSYDGNMRTLVYDDIKGMVIDSFKINRFPYRLVVVPFFSRTKSLINYFLKTKDSLLIESTNFGDSIQYSFTIFDDVIELIGNQIVHDTIYQSAKGNISKYDIWFSKQSNLPYKIVRDLPGYKVIDLCNNPEFNKIKLEDFRAADYFPKGYEIRQYKQKGRTEKKSDLIGTVASDWTLTDSESQTIALKDLKSKILLVQFTGIGCGACQASIPFLKQLVIDYQDKDFEFISLESWGSKVVALKKYKNHYKLNYKFIETPKEIARKYNVSAVPVFFILDENRIIRKIIHGYGKGTTDKQIREAINELI